MQLGDENVGELDTASIATAYRTWHIQLLSLQDQQKMRILFVKILVNLTHRIVSNQVGLIKQALKHQALSLLPQKIEGLPSIGFLRQMMVAFMPFM